MKYFKIVFCLSLLLNFILIANITLKNRKIEDSLSLQTYKIQQDIVQLEYSIYHQTQNNWPSGHLVLEKIEDIQEEGWALKKIGKDIGGLSSAQEEDIDRLSHLLSKYPEYSGIPDQEVSEDDIKILEELQKNLREVGWGMNLNYSGSWESFSEKLNQLLSKGI